MLTNAGFHHLLAHMPKPEDVKEAVSRFLAESRKTAMALPDELRIDPKTREQIILDFLVMTGIKRHDVMSGSIHMWSVPLVVDEDIPAGCFKVVTGSKEKIVPLDPRDPLFGPLFPTPWWETTPIHDKLLCERQSLTPTRWKDLKPHFAFRKEELFRYWL